jgi:hypothetical protein
MSPRFYLQPEKFGRLCIMQDAGKDKKLAA